MLVLKNLMFAGVLTSFAAPPAEEAPGTQPPDGVDDSGATSAAPGAATPPETTAAPPATSEAPPSTAPSDGPPAEGTTAETPVSDPAGTGEAASGPDQAEPPPPVPGAEPPRASGRDETERGNGKKKKPKSRSHLKTGGISVAPGIGFGLRTAGDKFCGQFSSDNSDQDGRRALCTGATPWVMDFTAMYGVFDRLDISLGLRLNLQPRSFRNDECPSDNPVCDRGQGLFNNTLGVGIMPGVRIWGGDVDKIVKMGGAIDFLYMYESFAGYRNRPLADEDDDSQPSEDGVGDHMLGLRAGPVLQIDPHHNVGIYLIPAAVPSFRPARDGFDEAGWFEIAFEATLGVQGRFP